MDGGKKTALTIKKEIFILSFTFLFLVAALFAGILIRFLYIRNMTDAKSSLRQCSGQIVTYTEGMFHENASIVSMLAENETIIKGGSESAVMGIYNEIKKDNDNITYIYSGYEDGRIVIEGYTPPAGFDTVNRPWYRAAAETDGVARLVYMDAATGVWMFSQSKKLTDSQGNRVGVVCIDCSNESINRRLSTKYQYSSQRSYIVDREGVVLIHPDETKVNDSLKDSVGADTWAVLAQGSSNYMEYDELGKNTMGYLEKIPDTEFMVVTAINSAEVTVPVIKSILFLLVVIGGLSIPMGFVLTSILMRRFARPIIELNERLRNVAAGRQGQSGDLRSYNEEINGIAQNIDIIVKNIANREELRKAAEFLSFHDSMTGLYNRRFLEEELRRLDVNRNYPLCVVCCDINGLKLVNDVFGHAVGDRLIVSVAQSLKAGCRADDILARTGGDEFVIILPCTSAQDAEKVLKRIRSGFPQSNICGAEVSASIGYAVKTDSGQMLNTVMHAADEIMYKQKIAESMDMKRCTVENIIRAAEEEGVVRSLTCEEESLLDSFADELCPGSKALLRESYRLRKIGLCSLIPSAGYGLDSENNSRTETGYRILSAVDTYRNAAGCILHYKEYYDGSGSPAGLAGRDIPLLSRIMAVTEAFLEEGKSVLDKVPGRYDPRLTEMICWFDGS